MCLCALAYLHVCEHDWFHIPTYHTQFCVHASADVTVLMMIKAMVFIHLRRWKKVDGVE